MADPAVHWNAEPGKIIEGKSITSDDPAGRWEIVDQNVVTKIGGQSKLYNAKPLDDLGKAGERWVVKVYNQSLSDDEKAFRKLIEISRKIIRQPHAHIFPISEGIEFRDADRLYFAEVMPLCPGGNLYEHYRRLPPEDLLLPETIARTERAIRQVGEALDHSHNELQWAHCDVRAVNILVRGTENFDCALADFGVAKEGEQRPAQFLKGGRQVTQVQNGYGSPELLSSTSWRVRKPGDFFLLGLTLLDLYTLLPGPDDLGIRVLSGDFLGEIDRLPDRLRTLALALLNGCDLGRTSWVQVRAFAEKHVSRPAVLSHLLQPSLFEEEPNTVRPYAIALHIAGYPHSWFERRTEFLSAIRRWLWHAEGRASDTGAVRQAHAEISEKGYADPNAAVVTPFKVALLLDNTIPLRVGETEIYSLLELYELLDGQLNAAAVRTVDFTAVATLLDTGILQEWIARVRPLPDSELDHLTTDAERADCLCCLEKCLAAIHAREIGQETTNTADGRLNGSVLRWLALRHCVVRGVAFRPPEKLPPEVCERFAREDGDETTFTWLLSEQLESLDRWRKLGWLSVWHDAKSFMENGEASPYGLASSYAGTAPDLQTTTRIAIDLGARGRPKLCTHDLSVSECRENFWGVVRHGNRIWREIRIFNEGVGVLAGVVQIKEEHGNPKFFIEEICSNDQRKVRSRERALVLARPGGLAVPRSFDASHQQSFVGNDLVVVIALDPGRCAIRDKFSAEIQIHWNEDGVVPSLSKPPNHPVLSRYYSADINMEEIVWSAGLRFLAGGVSMLVVGLLALLMIHNTDALSVWLRPRTGEDGFWVLWSDWHPLGPFVPGGNMSNGFYGLCLVGGLTMLVLGVIVYHAVFAHRRKDQD